MPEEKRKINAWIPVSLYDKLENSGYENITQALIKALESFGEDPQEDITGYIQDIEGYKQDIAGYKQDIAALTVENDKLKEDISGYHRIQEGYKQDIDRIHSGYKEDISRIQKDLDKKNQDIIGYTQDIKALNNEIERLKEDLKRAPDLVEFAQLQARYEAIQMVLEEKDKSIERLENDLKKADIREEDLKQMHNNYMLQVQSLINARALTSPGSTQKEEIHKESKPAQKENKPYNSVVQEYKHVSKEKPDIEPENKPEVKQEEKIKNIKEVICLNCGDTFPAERNTRKFCSSKCKTAYYRKISRKEVSG